MRKLVLFIHISLDGFTADSNGSMDWIKVDEEMFDYAGQRTKESDIALYGRGTFKLMESYWPTAADSPKSTKHDIEHSVWYNKVDKILASRTWKEPIPSKTRVLGDNLVSEIKKLKKQDGKDIIMFGSPTLAQSMIRENLIDDYWLFINPILLGRGTTIFKGLESKIMLKLMLNKTFSSGVVCLHFTLKADN